MVYSDVWSLACTLVELFTEKDCWEQLLEDKEAAAGKGSDGSGSDVKALIAVMKKKECPHSLESLPTTVAASLDILKGCLKYEMAMRARPINTVNAFS